jgi:hypothetical protein
VVGVTRGATNGFVVSSIRAARSPEEAGDAGEVKGFASAGDLGILDD